MSRQRLGQHFLADAGWRARIRESLRPEPDDLWVEIGAGHGEMTRELAASAARVVAIEMDAQLVETLRALASEKPNIEVAAADVLKVDLACLLGNRRVRIYGNLPYYITSPILHRLFEHAWRIASIHVVIQLEVAARLAARPGRRDYGYLSVATQYFTRPEIVFRIPPGAFRPRPKVASALVAMSLPGAGERLHVTDEAAFLGFVQSCFAQKRKTLANNLRAVAPPQRVAEALAAAALGPKARAEELTLPQFAALFREMAR